MQRTDSGGKDDQIDQRELNARIVPLALYKNFNTFQTQNWDSWAFLALAVLARIINIDRLFCQSQNPRTHHNPELRRSEFGVKVTIDHTRFIHHRSCLWPLYKNFKIRSLAKKNRENLFLWGPYWAFAVWQGFINNSTALLPRHKPYSAPNAAQRNSEAVRWPK